MALCACGGGDKRRACTAAPATRTRNARAPETLAHHVSSGLQLLEGLEGNSKINILFSETLNDTVGQFARFDSHLKELIIFIFSLPVDTKTKCSHPTNNDPKLGRT